MAPLPETRRRRELTSLARASARRPDYKAAIRWHHVCMDASKGAMEREHAPNGYLLLRHDPEHSVALQSLACAPDELLNDAKVVRLAMVHGGVGDDPVVPLWLAC